MHGKLKSSSCRILRQGLEMWLNDKACTKPWVPYLALQKKKAKYQENPRQKGF
jgi:hypothetical protein